MTADKDWTENQVLWFLQRMSSTLIYFSKSHLPTIGSEQIIWKKENSIYNLAIMCVDQQESHMNVNVY